MLETIILQFKTYYMKKFITILTITALLAILVLVAKYMATCQLSDLSPLAGILAALGVFIWLGLWGWKLHLRCLYLTGSFSRARYCKYQHLRRQYAVLIEAAGVFLFILAFAIGMIWVCHGMFFLRQRLHR